MYHKERPKAERAGSVACTGKAANTETGKPKQNVAKDERPSAQGKEVGQ